MTNLNPTNGKKTVKSTKVLLAETEAMHSARETATIDKSNIAHCEKYERRMRIGKRFGKVAAKYEVAASHQNLLQQGKIRPDERQARMVGCQLIDYSAGPAGRSHRELERPVAREDQESAGPVPLAAAAQVRTAKKS